MRSLSKHSGGHGLSAAQRRLLRTLAKRLSSSTPEPLNISQLCAESKVSRKVWYKMVESEEMAELLPASLDFLLGQSLLQVTGVLVQRALAGSAKHSELLYKLVGLLGSDEPKFLQIFNKDSGDQTFLTEERIRQMIENAKTQKKLTHDVEVEEKNEDS